LVRGVDTEMGINPKKYTVISILISVVHLFIIVIIVDAAHALDSWIQIILIANAVIISPILMHSEMYDCDREKYIKQLARFSGILFLIAFIYIHFSWLWTPIAGWVVIGLWFFFIPGIIFFCVAIALASFADKIFSPINKKISGYVCPALYIALIIVSCYVFIGGLQLFLLA